MTSITKEVWKPVVGYETHYEVSNLGQIRRVQRPMKLQTDVSGYKSVCLSMVSPLTGHKQQKGIKVHRIVAKAFLGDNDLPMQVNHIDGNKTNNRVENLEWCTGSENVRHAWRIGLNTSRKGAENYQAKLTEEIVREIKKSTETSTKIARRYGVTYWTIRDVRNGKSWGWV